jgi:hypothetical protein
MSSADLIRWGALGDVLAGVAWVVSGLISLVVPGQGTEEIGSSTYYLLETILCIAAVGMLGGLAGLHASQAASYGQLGAVSFYAAFIGSALILISTAATILAGREVLNFLFALGYLGTLGLVFLGVATLRARVLPQWCGVLLIVAVFGIPIYFALGDYGGAMLYGLVWLVLGYALWSHSGASAKQSSRMS